MLSLADTDADSQRRFVAPSALSPWSVAVEISVETYRAPFVKASVALAAAIVLTTLAAIFGGQIASRRLAKSVASLAHAGSGDGDTGRPEIAEISAVRRMLAKAKERQDQAEIEQRKSEQRFRAVFDQSAVGVSMTS